MNCDNCGHKIIQFSRFCGNCGVTINIQYIEPVFEIDSPNGRVLCKSHSGFEEFESSSLTDIEVYQRDKKLTCETCLNYIHDRCFFPKSEIDKIKLNSNFVHRKYRCHICNARVHLLFDILYRLYQERKTKVKISYICCSCYHVLNDRINLKNQRRYLLSSALWMVAFALIICNPTLLYFFSSNLFSLVLLVALAIVTIMLSYIFVIKLVRYLRRSKFLKRFEPNK